jgi:hypothetical protein
MPDDSQDFRAEPSTAFAEQLEGELVRRLLAVSTAPTRAARDLRTPVAPSVRDEADQRPFADVTRQLDEPSRSRRPRWLAVAAVAAVVAVIVGAVVAYSVGGDGPHAVRTDPASAPPASGPDTGSGLAVPEDNPTATGSSAPQVSSVTVGGPGLVAVGWEVTNGGSDAAVWTSVDGATWSRAPDDGALGGPGNQVMRDVTAGGPGLVAVGRDSVAVGSETYAVAAVWTSVDGFTWSRVAHDDGVFGRATGLPDDIFRMTAVTEGGPGLVAVGERGGESDQVEYSGAWIGDRAVGAAWTSVDGVTWSRVPHNPKVFGEWDEDEGPVSAPMHGLSVSMRDVTTGGPGLVAVGDVYRGGWGTGRGAAWTSTDGVTWSLADDHIEAVSVLAVTAGGPGLVVVGFATETPIPSALNETWMAAVWTSTDGATWSRVPPQPEVLGGPGWQGMGAVTTGGPGLVAVGGSPEGPTAWTSTDGITWSRVDTATLRGRDDVETLLRIYAFGRL